MKKCTKCGLIKSEDKFSFKDKKLNLRHSQCKVCNRRYTLEYNTRPEVKQRMFEFHNTPEAKQAAILRVKKHREDNSEEYQFQKKMRSHNSQLETIRFKEEVSEEDIKYIKEKIIDRDELYNKIMKELDK